MMTKENTGGPAFPYVCDADFDYGTGMTLRDYFAAKAMQGQLSACDWEFTGGPMPKDQLIDLVYCSYQIADAMISVRESA